MLNSMLETVRLLAGSRKVEEEIKTCRICGEPSSHDVCRACQFRIELGLLEKPVFRLE